MMTIEECIEYEQIVELGIATVDELNLARNLVAGSWTEVLADVCYIRTGYRTTGEMLEAEDEEE